ncbi:uncharacterized protein LOC130644951 [Hydractinia symbiolongicarpus]|uniref:uncharacterized protein LOC130644951 n=1 Tax=Hydractinia symbiolongicarpus TaxID=13093 RepID=UPI00254DBF4D|nr:uncharacterized protein LOC130644951 [Hydractinia symbiolongicarpus]
MLQFRLMHKMFIFAFRVKKYSEQFQMASSSGQNITSSSPAVTSQPISLVGSMGLVQNTGQQIVQNMNILQNPINVHQIAALQAQAQQRASAQQVQPVVLGNQHGVTTLQNVQVLGSATHHQDGIGNLPINIITTGGQTYAVASNLQVGVPSQNSVPAQMQIRSIAPNAATVVNQLQTNQVAVQQVRGNIQQQRLQNIGKTNRFPDGASTTTMNSPNTGGKAVQQGNLSLPLQSTSQSSNTNSSSAASHSQILTKRKLQDLLHEIDPTETMDDDVEEVLLQIADDFIENVINSSCQIAKHRKSNTVEVKDVQLHLDRNWNMWIPGYGSEDLRPYKKLPSTEAHRQRLALIKKAMKK